MIPASAIELTLTNELRRAAYQAERRAICDRCNLDPEEYPHVRPDAEEIIDNPAFAAYLGDDETCSQ